MDAPWRAIRDVVGRGSAGAFVDDPLGLADGAFDATNLDDAHLGGNAEEGMKKFQAGVKVDLLITDLNMPGMNGIQFIREVRKLPNYKFMPILFLTTESQQEKRAEAKAAGASGWIVKPATADQLLNTIKLVLR